MALFYCLRVCRDRPFLSLSDCGIADRHAHTHLGCALEMDAMAWIPLQHLERADLRAAGVVGVDDVDGRSLEITLLKKLLCEDGAENTGESLHMSFWS